MVTVDDPEVQNFPRGGEGICASGDRGEVNPNRKSACCSPWKADKRPDDRPRAGGMGWVSRPALRPQPSQRGGQAVETWSLGAEKSGLPQHSHRHPLPPSNWWGLAQ